LSIPVVKDAGVQAPTQDADGPLEQSLPNDIPLSLKATLVDDCGVPYREFRRTLEPRWWRVVLELVASYTVMLGVLAVLVVLDPGWPWAVPATLVGGFVLGYTIHFINLFMHEAAHFNLVPGRKRNDLVANVLMSWMFGTSVALYRQVHWQHHRELGTTMDSENSYFDALRIRYLVEGLTGLKLLRSLRQHHQSSTAEAASGGAVTGRKRFAWLAFASAVNLAIAAALFFLLGSPVAAISWLGGLLVVFPFLASLRTLLEHRSEEADADVDYHEVEHGPVNRLFGGGPFASTLGSAGFNRHAIHHWEPQLSYTRLADVEAYLLRTEAAPLVRERQTTYVGTFLRLLEL
jgi:fatty acid desaturase